MNVAQIILAQLGGSRFVAMTGAKNLIATGQDEKQLGALSFRLPRGFAKNGINYVRVTLDFDDTYTVLFAKFNTRSYEVKKVSEFSGVYNDMLRELFTSETGLHTSL